MDNIEDIKKECERYRLLYENANNSLTYWETKCRKLEIENEQMKFQLDNAPLGLLDTYKQALQEIRDIAKETMGNQDPYIRMYAGEMYCRPIIDKINEVIGGDNG